MLDLVIDDEGDQLDDAERAALEQVLVESNDEALRGETRDASEILRALRARR